MSLTKNTSATLTAALPTRTVLQTTSTVRSGSALSTSRTPSATSRQCPLVRDSCERSWDSPILETSTAETRNVTALTAYGTEGLHTLTMTPPMTGPTIHAAFSIVWRSELAFVSSSSGTRFGRPA